MDTQVTQLTWEDTDKLLAESKRLLIKRQNELDVKVMRDDPELKRLRAQFVKLHDIRIRLNVQRLEWEREAERLGKLRPLEFAGLLERIQG